MAKSMAQISGGVVTNILWCSDSALETDVLINISDCPAGIGDTYDGGKFYRGGSEVLTTLEEANAEIVRLHAEIGDMQTALTTLGVTL